MAYGPRFTKTDFRGGKNILASEHLQYVEGGATLDHTKFDTGYNELGQLIARNTDTGKYEPFTTGEDSPDYDNHAVLNIDFVNNADQDLIAGEVIVRGSVYEAKLPQNVPTSFKEANKSIRYVNHV